jgi:hypothetical protein
MPSQKYCGSMCRDAYIADKQHGLIYPSWHEKYSKMYHKCIYCGAELPKGIDRRSYRQKVKIGMRMFEVK